LNKTCSKCGEVKPIGEFRTPDRRHQCKACEAEYHKQYRQANKEAITARIKQYYQDNKEAIAKYHKQHYQDNKETIAAYQKQYRQDNKEAIAEKRKQYYQTNEKEALAARSAQLWQETGKEYYEQYYQDNKEAIAKYHKQHFQDNKEALIARAKQRLQNLPAATYSITNTINGKIYIGQSTQWPRRWTSHKRKLRKNIHENRSLQQDYNEYGKDAFVFEVLEEYPADTSSKLLLERERETIMRSIREHKPLYNTLA